MRTMGAVGLCLSLLVCGASQCRAQGAAGIDFIELFSKLDANNDQVIEKGEVPESGRRAFDRLLTLGDTNKNGQLDRDEYRSLLESVRDQARELAQGGGQRLKAMDKDGDGKVSRGEFSGPPQRFDRLDANKDGFITQDEAAQFRGAGAGGPARPKGGAGQAGAPAARFKAMDKDGDGKVSRGEFSGPPQRFDRLDTNSDGFLTLQELRAGLAKAAKKAQLKKKAAAPGSD